MHAPIRRMAYRALRSIGLNVSRHRDPYSDAARLLAGVPVSAVVDGGAYVGSAVRRMLDAFPRATVHAFEPQALEFGRLSESFAGNGRVRLYPQALSNNSGRATLHITTTAYTTSLLEAAPHSGLHPSGQQPVETITLDDWWSAQGRPEVAFLKLDLQGHELQALMGARRMLAEAVHSVLTEVNFVARYEGQCFFHEVAAFLHQNGVGFHRLYEWLPLQDGSWRQADALFVRGAGTARDARGRPA